MRFLRWLFSKKVVIFWLSFMTVYDVCFTYSVFVLFPSLPFEEIEGNAMIRYLVDKIGFEWTLLVIFPLIMTFFILIIYRFWHRWLVRGYAYFLFVARIFLFFNSLYIAYLLYQYRDILA